MSRTADHLPDSNLKRSEGGERVDDVETRAAPASVIEPTVAARVRQLMAGLTPSEKRAANVLLSGYPMAGLATVAEFAARASVSAPSILRFIARIGFGSYADFQRALKDELEAQLQSPLMKQPSPPPADTPFAGFAAAVLANMRETFASIAPAEFDAVVALLADTRRPLHLVGGRLTQALAAYAVHHLRIIRPAVTLVEGQAANWRDQVIDFGKRDILIAFDIRRYQEDVVHFCEEAAARGATIILFTDQWLSPVAPLARHVLPARIAVPSHWDSNSALIAVVEALVAATTKTLWPVAEERMRAIEELRRPLRST